MQIEDTCTGKISIFLSMERPKSRRRWPTASGSS